MSPVMSPDPDPSSPSHLSCRLSCHLRYNSLKDFFPTMDIRPNPSCSNSLCTKRQGEHLLRVNSPEALAEAARVREEREREEAVAPVHEDNEWGIVAVSRDHMASSSSS